MRRAALLGNPDTRRTSFFERAAGQAGLPFDFIDWKDLSYEKERFREGEWLLKIDPPLWESCLLEELNRLAGGYKEQLKELSDIAKTARLGFLNHPLAIMQLLDKRVCKDKLTAAGIPVTKPLGQTARSAGSNMTAGELLEIMQRQKIYQVFIKPVNGSGAAGVSAFRLHPSTGGMTLYTCAMQRKGTGLVNTKRLRQFLKPDEVISTLDEILKLDCIVERWYAKEKYQGFSYDLRAVMQDGSLDFLLARLSKGPITNLHLNNRPVFVKDLGLPAAVTDAVFDLCKRAMDCFPMLCSAGIDILLEKGSKNPCIIEMNAQGDLIYQDIFHDNIIYRHQVQIMKDWINDEG